MIRLKQGGPILLLGLLLAPCHLHAGEPFAIDVQELDREKPALAPKHEKKKVQQTQRAEKKAKPHHPTEKSQFIHYTIKPGDHLFRILMVKLGMSEEAAEKLIPEILRINEISDVKNLRVGMALLIPRARAHAGPAAKKQAHRKRREAGEKLGKVEVVSRAERREAQREGEREKAAGAPCPVPPAAPSPGEAVRGSSGMEAPGAPVPAAPAPPVAPAPAPAAAAAWLCSVTETDPAKIVDSMLNALSVPYARNKIIDSAAGAATAFSVRVDRYFEYNGGRYAISIGDSDPYSYTLTGLLEGSGYHVLMLGAKENFSAVGEKLLKFVGIKPEFGSHQRSGGKEMMGFLVRPEKGAGKEVLVTSQPADKNDPFVMKPECAAR